MRALLISFEYPPYVVGGIGTHVASLVPCLGGQLVDGEALHVDVLTPRFAGGDSEEVVNEFITIHRVDVPPIDALDHYNSVIDENSVLVDYALKLGERHRYDIIHVHDWLTAKAGIRLKHAWKTPLVVTIHATERGRHQGWLPSSTSEQINQLEWRVCFEAWRVIVCSRFMLSELQNTFGVPPEKIDVVPNGVDLEAMGHCSLEEQEKARQQHAPGGERLLFFVGRIVHEKGVQFLVRAMPRILAQYPDTKLLVAGKNSQKLYPLAYELGVEQQVEFLGFITDEMRDCLYAVVDASVFPSLYEPFGIVALEAMANHCNVIASDTGGLSDVVRHEATGLTVYPGDPLSLAWAVDRLFSDPEAAAKRRAAAWQQVSTEYRWDKIAAQTVQTYTRVLCDRKGTEW